jgi:hypothetical protein
MQSGYWELPDKIETRGPLALLKTQASALTMATKGLLNGYVNLITYGENFEAKLYISAPALNNYIYSLLEVDYKVDMYPARLRLVATDESTETSNDEQFEAALKGFIQNPHTRRVVTSLMAQVQQMSDT